MVYLLLYILYPLKNHANKRHKSLPIENRIMLMEELWDSLCHENEEIKSPTWHQEILEERMELIKSGQAKFISIQELKNNNA